MTLNIDGIDIIARARQADLLREAERGGLLKRARMALDADGDRPVMRRSARLRGTRFSQLVTWLIATIRLAG
jgi:hypothetical protein